MNLIKKYFEMNSCVLEGRNIYFIDATDNTTKQLIGKVRDYSIENNTLKIQISKQKEDIAFLKIQIEDTYESTEEDSTL